MIGPIVNFDADIFRELLLGYLLIVVISVLLGGFAGWWLARSFGRNLELPEDETHSWLRHSPATPLLALVAFILPFLTPSFIVMCIALALLIAPTVFILFLRFSNIRSEDVLQAQLDRQAVLRRGWRDAGVVGFAFLLSGIVYAVLDPGARESVVDLLPNLFPGLVLGLIIGTVLGLILSFIRIRLSGYLEQRHHSGEYSPAVDGTLYSIRGGIESLLTQFHGTPLAGVLAIAAAALPFTTASQTPALSLLFFAPLASAMVAAMMVEDPAPNQPGVWQHISTGLSNVAQISIGYLVGAAMLVPFNLVYTWMLDQPADVTDALNTHLDLTFTALAYSIFLGVGGGILSSRMRILRIILTNLGNLGRTLPSLAVLALALPLFGVGRAPSLVALIFIGTLPILVNTTVGIVEVSHDIKEAARGMGMNSLQILVRVEVPIAIPVIMAGVRTSAVLVVASATLAGFIGGGGLGALIIRGDGSGRDDILLTGAVLSTMLAIFLEYFFGWLETLLTPRGLRIT